MARAHACRTTPKSARKGYPHSFRIDLAGDDRGGGSSSGGKFVISAPSAEEMIQWMERIGRYSGMKESDVAAWRRQSLRLSSSSGAAPPEPEPLASPPPSPPQQQQPQPRSRRHVGAMRCQFDGKGAFAQVFAELCETSLTLRERRDGPVLRTASLASGKVSAPKSARKVGNKPQCLLMTPAAAAACRPARTGTAWLCVAAPSSFSKRRGCPAIRCVWEASGSAEACAGAQRAEAFVHDHQECVCGSPVVLAHPHRPT
eukprot:COSAG01_NODE_1539_length_9983_cov_211.998381_4_plen_258_part_00